MRRILFLATVAVFVIVGGAYAAGTITGASIKDGTISTKDVKNKSLKSADLSSSAKRQLQGNRGRAGSVGPVGPAGPPGPTVTGQITRVASPELSIAANDVDSVTASCPPGQNVVSGGYVVFGADTEVFYTDDFGGRTSWSVGVDNFDSSISAEATALAYCAPAGTAVAAKARPDVRSKANARDAKMLALHQR